MFKGFYQSLTFRLTLLLILTVAGTWLYLEKDTVWFILTVCGWLFALSLVRKTYKKYAQKVAFMFDAIDNSDYAFKYATYGQWSNDKMVNDSLNRITRILFQAKSEAIQKEKYYELIMNSINTGIIVIDDNGYIYQTNNEALRILGLVIFTHVKQIKRVDETLVDLFMDIKPGKKSRPLLPMNGGPYISLSGYRK